MKWKSKNYVEVYWTPWTQDRSMARFSPFYLMMQEPSPLLTEISKERLGIPAYMKCPAFLRACQNSFLIRCPMDINITINSDRTVSTDRYGQDFFELFIGPRSNQTHEDNPYLMDTFPEYLFYANDSVEMEMLDPIILHGRVSQNVRVIPGKFDISKWIRPIQYAFEVIDSSRPLEFRAGDPLFMVRFKTKDDLPVKFIRTSQDREMNIVASACVGLKDFRPRLSLAKMYEIASGFVSHWKDKRK